MTSAKDLLLMDRTRLTDARVDETRRSDDKGPLLRVEGGVMTGTRTPWEGNADGPWRKDGRLWRGVGFAMVTGAATALLVLAGFAEVGASAGTVSGTGPTTAPTGQATATSKRVPAS